MAIVRCTFVLLLASFCVTGYASGDAENALGLKVFSRCLGCHEVGKDAKHNIGPHLNGVLNRSVGSAPDYPYSDALITLGKQGQTWSEKALDRLLTAPEKNYPGSKMPNIAAVADKTERAAVIALLSQITEQGDGAPAPKAPAITLPDSLLAVKGDPEYGEYLAGECITCHQADGSNQGIPSITGWPVRAFLEALQAYRTGARENPVMQNIAKPLGDEEIAALAAYFTKQ